MNAYLIDDGAASGLHKFRCSNCGDNIRVDHSPDKLRFCWHCSMQFWPKPKPGTTPGEWYYDPTTKAIYSKRGSLGERDTSVAEVYPPNTTAETNANGYLMAASKKLLAACKNAVITFGGGIHVTVVNELRDAIAEAEKGMQ